MAEEFGVDGSRRDGSAVDCKETAVAAAAVLVYYLGQNLLADAAFAAYEHAEVGRGYCHRDFYCVVELQVISYDSEAVFQYLQFLCIHKYELQI